MKTTVRDLAKYLECSNIDMVEAFAKVELMEVIEVRLGDNAVSVEHSKIDWEIEDEI